MNSPSTFKPWYDSIKILSSQCSMIVHALHSVNIHALPPHIACSNIWRSLLQVDCMQKIYIGFKLSIDCALFDYSSVSIVKHYIQCRIKDQGIMIFGNEWLSVILIRSCIYCKPFVCWPSRTTVL